MHARLSELLERYVSRCGPELLLEHGAVLTRLEPQPEPSYTLAGIVGFVGDLSGTLLVGSNAELIGACHPLRNGGRPLTERMLLDWIAELANQLMGRLKARLSEHGLSIKFSAPISLAGDRMRHLAARGRTYRAAFEGPGGEVNIWFDAEIKDVIACPEAFFDDAKDATGSEGDVIFL